MVVEPASAGVARTWQRSVASGTLESSLSFANFLVLFYITLTLKVNLTLSIHNKVITFALAMHIAA